MAIPSVLAMGPKVFGFLFGNPMSWWKLGRVNTISI